MFVFISLHDLDLTDAVNRCLLIDFAQKRNLETPGRRYPYAAGEVCNQCKLAGKCVPEIVQVRQKGVGPYDAPERPNQRGVKKTRDPAVKSVGHPGVIPFAEFEIRCGVNDGVNEPGEKFTFIIDDVAVVKRDGVYFSIGEDIPQGHPDGLSLSRIVQVEVGPAKLIIKGLHGRAVMPHDPDVR